jgi:hypothetical protein
MGVENIPAISQIPGALSSSSPCCLQIEVAKGCDFLIGEVHPLRSLIRILSFTTSGVIRIGAFGEAARKRSSIVVPSTLSQDDG